MSIKIDEASIRHLYGYDAKIVLKENLYNYHTDSTSWALNAANSDIIGVNGIYFADVCEGMTEGIHFVNTSTTWDSISSKSGVFYFASGHDKTASSLLGTGTLMATNYKSPSEIALNVISGHTLNLQSASGTSIIFKPAGNEKGKFNSSGIFELSTQMQPNTSNTHDLGTSSLLWKDVYATTFHGALNGNADTATALATGRTLKVSLGSTNASSAFDGKNNVHDIGVSGTLAVGNGGTGTSTAPVAGGVIYGVSTSAYGCTSAGSSGQLLQSAGAGKPTWIAATNANNGSTVVKRDSNGNFSAGTITATLNGTAVSLASSVNLTGNSSTSGVYWNPFTWTISKTWSGTTGIYTLMDCENSFTGIFQVKFRTGSSAVTSNAHSVQWLAASTTTPPTLTLTTETGSDNTVYRLYITAPGTHRTYRIYKISEYGTAGTVDTAYTTTIQGTAQSTANAVVSSKLGTTTLGSSIKPIYLSSGTATECSTYAGGTNVTLNGTNCGASTASFYAPTSVGTSGYVLQSNGSGAPTWINATSSNTASTVVKRNSSKGFEAGAVNLSGNLRIGNTSNTATTADAVGIYVRDLRAVSMTPDTLGEHTAVFYFDEAGPSGDASWKGILRIKGWEGAYAAWEIAGPATTSDTKNIYVRTGLGGSSWGSWRKLLDSDNFGDYAAAKSHSHSYLPLAGGTVTGDTIIRKIKIFEDTVTSGTSSGNRSVLAVMGDTYGNDATYIKTAGKLSFGDPGPQIQFISGTNPASGQRMALIYTDHNNIHNGNSLSLVSTETDCAFIAPKVYGAVWNDYAEYRASADNPLPGQVVIENGDDTLSLSTKRLQPGANIVSDTFGFAIGQTSECKTPIAVSGRVLAYPYENRNTFQAGDPVCSGPNGTVSKMTREEVITYPDRIIGTVSAIPSYDIWGTGEVEVNGRIWIKVK